MPRQAKQGVWVNRMVNLIPVVLLAALWTTQMDKYLFLDIRDHLLLSNSIGRKVNNFYYNYTLYPAEAQDWVRWQNIPRPPETYSPLCPNIQTASAEPQTGDPPYPLPLTPYSLLLTSPDQGSRYRLSPEIPRAAQQIVVAARPADGVSLRRVTLLADGHPLATLTRPPYQALWPMAVGEHVFTALGVDAEGNEIEGNHVTVEVVE